MRRPSLLLVAAVVIAPAGWADAAPAHVTGRIDEVFRRIIREHAFDAAVPAGWRIDGFQVKDDRIELVFAGRDKAEHAVALELGPGGPSDGLGQHFRYRLIRGAETSGDRQALLKAAALVDAATPPEAIASDAPPPPPQPMRAEPPHAKSGEPAAGGGFVAPDVPMVQATIPKPAALALGALQTLLLLAAAAIGIGLPRRRRKDANPQQR